MTWMIFFAVPNLMLLIHGGALFTALKSIFGIRRANFLFSISVSYLLGELVVVLFLNLSSMLFGRFRWGLLWVTTAMGLLFLAWKAVRTPNWKTILRDKSKEFFSPPSLIPFFLILIICVPNFVVSFYDVLVQWDPRSIWFFHGKAFFYDNRIDVAFLKNPVYAINHPNYPVFIPLLSVFHMHFLGSWHEILNKSFIFFHWLAALNLLYIIWKALGVLPFFAFMGVSFLQFIHAPYAVWGLGDSLWSLALIMAMSLCFFLIERGDSDAGRLNALLGVLFLGMAAYVKEEGLMGATIFLGVYLLGCRFAGKSRFRYALRLVPLFAAIAATWYGFVALRGIKSSRPVEILGFLRYGLADLVKRTVIIFHVPFASKLMIPWQFYFAAAAAAFSLIYLLVRLRACREFATSWMIMATFWLIFLAYYLIFLGTPMPLEWHLLTSLERVVVVNVMLSLFSLIWLTRVPPGALQAVPPAE